MAWVLLSAGTAAAITPDDPGSADVQFTIDATQNIRAISPYIYGINSYASTGLHVPATLDRLGGNRWTGYNWETNASQAGADWYFQNDTYLGTGPPGAAVIDTLTTAAQNDRALVVTVPMAGYVAGDTAGPVQRSQVAPVADGVGTTARWKAVVPEKETIYPGASLSTTPNQSDGFVFTDEFVHWVEQNKQSGNVFYSLDNEPALWGEPLPADWQPGVPPPCPPCSPTQAVPPSPQGRTHGALHPYAPTFAELRAKTIAHASAIKNVAPDSMVFGGVAYGYAEFTGLQGATDATSAPSHPEGNQPGELHYLEWLLNEVRIEEQAQGRKLMDVLDVHWYPEASGGGVRIAFDNNPHPSNALIEARVQAPRSLWDDTYTESSWITDCCSGGPIKLLKHLQRDVDDFNPGTKLAITEYNYGGGAHISGAIAQADALGIFGREGLFAAALWPIADGNQSRFTEAAFKMFLNYDGDGGEFGDTSVGAATSSIAQSAIYASVDSTDPSRMILIAINRTNQPLATGLSVTSDVRFERAEVFQLTSANANPVQGADIPIPLVNAFQYTMPAYSVSTLVLHAAATLRGDFNQDGTVDGRDFLAWQRDPRLGSLADWQAGYATESVSATGVVIPEPTGLALVWYALVAYALRRAHADARS